METPANGLNEPSAGTSAALTVLDVLPANCWHRVFSHLTMSEVVGSERVSRAWQRVVLNYLEAFACNKPSQILKRPAPNSVEAARLEDGIEGAVNLKRNRNIAVVVTILDVLNADCWRGVLDYVSVGDIVRSERVCRAWQRVVLDYLAGVHQYVIRDLKDFRWLKSLPVSRMIENYYCRMIMLPRLDLFRNVMLKLGPFCTYIHTHNLGMERLDSITSNCPNLKQLSMKFSVSGPDEDLPRGDKFTLDVLKKCTQLKRISLNMCEQGNDNLLNDVVTNENLEELIIVKHRALTGSFLTNLRANLKTLAIVACESVRMEYILSVKDRLRGLTRLELNNNLPNMLRDSHLLLKETPHLEHLGLRYYEGPLTNYQPPWRNENLYLNDEVPRAIARLSQLRVLDLGNNMAVTDEWLLTIARSCERLRSVNVSQTRVSGHGVLAMCQARPTLVELTALFIRSNEVEACVRCCRNLEYLELLCNQRLTADLVSRLAWPRATPLRLRAYNTKLKDEDFEGIILVKSKSRSPFWPH